MPSKEVQFWDWFQQHEAALYDADQHTVDVFQLLNEALAKVSEGLTFEFSAAPKGAIKEFCISADGIKEHFPAVINLVKEAPSFENWSIRAFRQRISNDNIAISMGDLDLSYDDLYFIYAPDHGKIDLQIHGRNYTKENKSFISATFIMLDALLGEYDVATQISSIEWVPLDENNLSELSEFTDLRNLIDDVKAMKN